MLIVYCESCGFRVSDEEMKSGTAVKAEENKYFCAKCAAAGGKKTAPPPVKLNPRHTPDSTPRLVLEEARPAPIRGATHQHVLPPAAQHGRSAATTGKPTGKKSDSTPLVVGGVCAGVALLLIGVFAFGGKKSEPGTGTDTAEKPAASQGETSSSRIPSAANSKPAPAVEPPRVTSGNVNTAPTATLPQKATASQQDRERELEKENDERKNRIAAKLLEEHKAWFQSRPEDPWGYKERLMAFAGTYRSTPSAAEAQKLMAEIKFPDVEPSPDSSLWYRSWTFTAGLNPGVHENIDGRRYVLETHPPEATKVGSFTRKLKVPADKALYEFSVRGHDHGDFKLIIVADGKTGHSEDIGGRDWRTYTLDLAFAKGREIDVTVHHNATGWHFENGYWTAPRFVTAASPGARMIAFDGTSTAPKIAATAPQPVTVAAAVNDGRPWEPIFDGATVKCLARSSQAEWKVENGSLVNTAARVAGQTAQEFSEGELKIRFELAGTQNARFTVRQGEAGGYAFKTDRPGVTLVAGRPQELLITMRGDDVSGTLNGQALRPEVSGKPRNGRLQMSVTDGTMRIVSLEFREFAPAAAERPWTAYCRMALDELNIAAPNTWREENGVLANTAGGHFQTKRDMEDGEVRIRFETQNATWVEFAVHQGDQQGYQVNLARNRLDALGGKPGEVIFTVRGEQVSATLNGQPIELDPGGKLRRGKVRVYNANGAMKILSIEYREIGASSPPATAVVPPATEPAKALPGPASIPADTNVLYEAVQSDVYALLSKNGINAALIRLETAKADAKLSAVVPLLDADIRLVRLYENVNQAVLKGAAALIDKRPFVLRRTDGKEVALGKGAAGTVLEVKDDTVQVEQNLGGGKATLRWPVEQLTPQTRFELARIGYTGAPDGELKLAMAQLVMLNAGLDITPKMIRVHLDAARKENAPAELIAQINARLEARDRELSTEAALKKLDALLKEKRWPEAKKQLESTRKEFSGTLALAKAAAELEKKYNDIDYALNPARPGLWGSYWSAEGDNWFKTMHFARADQKLSFNCGEGKCDERVPENEFAIKWAGKIRIDRDGTYRFKLWADDLGQLFIDGKKLIEQNQEQELPLAKGEHDFKLIFREYGGGAGMSLVWKIDNQGDFQEIPASQLWHDPRMLEKYQKE